MKSRVVDRVLEQKLGDLSGSKRLFHSSLKIGVMGARDFFIGGLVAALLWQTTGSGFALFVASSTRDYAIY